MEWEIKSGMIPQVRNQIKQCLLCVYVISKCDQPGSNARNYELTVCVWQEGLSQFIEGILIFFLIAFFTFSMQSYSFSFRELRFNAVDFY